MASSKEYLSFLMEQFSDLEGITARAMMGEYILYYHGKIAAYVCDDRLLVKPVPAAKAMMPEGKYEPPYDGAKDMLLVEQVDDREFLAALFKAMYLELPEQKKRKKKEHA